MILTSTYEPGNQQLQLAEPGRCCVAAAGTPMIPVYLTVLAVSHVGGRERVRHCRGKARPRALTWIRKCYVRLTRRT